MIELLHSVASSSALSGIGGVLIGLVVGQRLQLWLSRRSEYNELADKLFLWFDQPVRDTSGHFFELPDTEIKLIRRRMGCLQRMAFDAELAACRLAAEKQETRNDHSHFTDPDAVNASLRKLAAMMRRR